MVCIRSTDTLLFFLLLFFRRNFQSIVCFGTKTKRTKYFASYLSGTPLMKDEVNDLWMLYPCENFLTMNACLNALETHLKCIRTNESNAAKMKHLMHLDASRRTYWMRWTRSRFCVVINTSMCVSYANCVQTHLLGWWNI